MGTCLPSKENYFTKLIIPLLKKKKPIFGDTTGTITVSLWREFIRVVQVGKVYQIAPLQVKTWNGLERLSGNSM